MFNHDGIGYIYIYIFVYLLGPLDGRVKTSPFYLLGVFSLGGLPGGGKFRLVFLRSISVLASDLAHAWALRHKSFLQFEEKMDQ